MLSTPTTRAMSVFQSAHAGCTVLVYGDSAHVGAKADALTDLSCRQRALHASQNLTHDDLVNDGGINASAINCLSACDDRQVTGRKVFKLAGHLADRCPASAYNYNFSRHSKTSTCMHFMSKRMNKLVFINICHYYTPLFLHVKKILSQTGGAFFLKLKGKSAEIWGRVTDWREAEYHIKKPCTSRIC
jgi:hypothetical protein